MAEVPPFLYAKAGDNDSPFAYVVPGAGEVQPYTATATYTNASGQAIIPALRIKSQSGNLLALVFPGDTIADGSSAEVSFVPPFGSAASSPAPAASGPNVQMATVVGGSAEGGTNQTYNAGAQAYIQFDSTIFQTDGGAVFAWSTGIPGFRILQPGFYMAVVQWEFNAASPPTAIQVAPFLLFDRATGETIWQTKASPDAGEVTTLLYGLDAGDTGRALNQTVSYGYVDDVPGNCQVQLQNNSANPFTLNARTFHIMQLRAMTVADFAGFPFSFP